MSKRKVLTRGQLIVIVSMICIMLLAVTMSVYFASMTAHKYGKNMVYIASLGTLSASATAMGKLYPGGTSSTPMKFELQADNYQVTDVLLSNYRLTSFTLEWGGNKSKTFLPQSGDNGPIITTTAGEWAFELNVGTGELSDDSPLNNAFMNITVPAGAPSGSTGNPNYGYLVQSITKVSCTFDLSVTLNAVKNDRILTIYQAENTSSKNWTKLGHNATLNATATKIEENSLDDLHTMLTTANGGNVVANANDDYLNAVVYKDIDLVNIDIATGEPIGRLSDTSYSFEWYGGTVTMNAGDRLASGRVLTQQETFTVDVYTYYPEFYIRRYAEGGFQYISISDKRFDGAVKIDDWYSATFESTIFNPNGDVANLNGKIIPRSYVYDYTPLTNGSAKYIHDNYYQTASTVSGYTNSPYQIDFMTWATNLTTVWKSANLTSIEGYLPNGSIAQGENYVAYIYGWLYLVKYANNDSQSMVGYGNTYTRSLYYATGTTVTTNVGIVTTGGNDANSRYESEKGGAVIGCFNTGTVNAAYEYSTTDMAYGYKYISYEDSVSNNSGHKKGLYANQFLTNTYNDKRVLLDGYVGSDKYTSVFCLGRCNPWGNVWKWVFGNVVNGVQNGDSVDINLYTTFENFDGSNWYMTSTSSTEEKLTTGNYNYVKMSYSLPSEAGWYNHLGTSAVTSDNGLQALVGVQTAQSSKNRGLSDYYYVTTNTNYLNSSFGVLLGGATNDTTSAGAFYFYVSNSIVSAATSVGFRTMLVA